MLGTARDELVRLVRAAVERDGLEGLGAALRIELLGFERVRERGGRVGRARHWAGQQGGAHRELTGENRGGSQDGRTSSSLLGQLGDGDGSGQLEAVLTRSARVRL